MGRVALKVREMTMTKRRTTKTESVYSQVERHCCLTCTTTRCIRKQLDANEATDMNRQTDRQI